MDKKSLRKSKLAYLLFLLPLVLAFLSWQYFPTFAEWLIRTIFRYTPSNQPGSTVWFWTIRFFYTWYTFVAIGLAGVWAIAAALSRSEHKKGPRAFYPTVSLIVPAFNEEKNISRCLASLYRCAERYAGRSEIIVVDDGSTDYTYELAWSTMQAHRSRHPQVRTKIVRHATNLGKTEAIKSGVNTALGGFIAIVDADSWWMPDTLVQLADYLLLNGKKAVTGYVHPSDGDSEMNPYVVLQQLEYSQGLGITRQAQLLNNSVLVVSGAIGMYDADVLRGILMDHTIKSVTEDLEITLEMHDRNAGVGYISLATSSTIVPQSFNVLWNQRLRWFSGWLHNTLRIHRKLFLKRSRLSLLLWYCYIFEFGGAFIDIAALLAFPLLFWFAPDRIFFVLSLLIFVPYGLLIGMLNQALALKYAYNKRNYHALLFYTPFYPIIRLVNIFARLTSTVKFLVGNNGDWHHSKHQ
jgi:biofilm PGA synthesis N-glycosyltransferase PgaC